MSGKRLISEADVLAMAAGEELSLDRGTIATPSALDAAFRKGIRVRRTDGHSARTASGRGSSRECLWHRMMSTDGTFVVQVVNGRATVSQLTDAGPVSFGTDSVEEHDKR